MRVLKIGARKSLLKSYDPLNQPNLYTINNISAADTLSIRQQVLRPNLAVDQCHFDGDLNEATFHLGALVDGTLIGIATMMRDASPELAAISSDQFRLRGMAVLPGHRDQGIGRAILDNCIEEVRQRDCNLFWCNARETAARFYTAAGFSKTSETTFDIPTAGPHFVMYKQL